MEPVSFLAKLEKVMAIVAHGAKAAYYAVQLNAHKWLGELVDYLSNM